MIGRLFRRVPAPPPAITTASAARELGRLGGRAIGARRHAEAEAKHHAQHERVKAVARSMRANAHPPMRPLPILEPSELKGA